MRARDDRRRRALRRAGLHRHPSPHRILAGHARSNSTAACCRMASRRRSATRTRSPTCSGAEGIRYFLDCADADGDGHPRQPVLLRAGDRRSRPRARGSRSPTSLPFRAHPKVIGLAEMMNFPGVLDADPGIIAKLAAFQGRPHRRPRAAGARHAISTAISPPASAPTTRRPAPTKRARSSPRAWPS